MSAIDGELSDLFFNHEHPEYETLFERAKKLNADVHTDQIRAAILVDAENFIKAYPTTCGFHGVSLATELADDFMVRL